MRSPLKSQRPATHSRRPLWFALAFVAIITAGVPAYLVWKQRTRPGMIHYQRGLQEALQPAVAQQEWLAGIQEDPTFAPCYVRLGDYYLSVQRPREAALSYSAATQLLPNDGLLFLHLAQAQQQQGDEGAATNAAKRATELLPDDADAFQTYGTLEERQNDLPPALAALRCAHALRPGDRDLLMQLVQLEVTAHDFGGAYGDLTPYLKSHPQDGEACYLMSGYYAEQPHGSRNVRAALQYARLAHANAPDNPYACAELGEVSLEAGRTGDALKAYLAGRRLSPHSDRVLQGLIRCYDRLDRPQQAGAVAAELAQVNRRHDKMEHLKDVMRFNPANINAELDMARLEEADGASDLAGRYYADAAHRAPGDPRARSALAAFDRRTRRPGFAAQAVVPNAVPQVQGGPGRLGN